MEAQASALALLGATASPYTRKMLALLRYRQIPYRLYWGDHSQAPAGFPVPRVKLLPTFYFPGADGDLEAVVDSTPIIRRLEQEHAARAVLPPDPAMRFLCDLIEDYADEWLTKAMFHYRWAHAECAENVGPLLMFSGDPSMDAAAAKDNASVFSRRQVERLSVVGSNAQTGPIIEDSYCRFVEIFDAILAQGEFLLGARPCAADFAIHGQLTQLGIVDPVPAARLRASSPRLRAWIDRVEDLSGISVTDNDWGLSAQVAYAVAPLLAEIGRVYLPFLHGNALALAAGRDTVDIEIDGRPWTQAVFPYQVKCFAALRDSYAALDAPGRELLDPVLQATTCAKYLDAN